MTISENVTNDEKTLKLTEIGIKELLDAGIHFGHEKTKWNPKMNTYIHSSRKGIHIIDNRNVTNPINIGFITLPGNYDLATKGDYLYADSYLDLVVFDISDINSITEVNRLKNNFDNYYLNQGLYNEDQGVIVGYKEELKEEYIENHDCGLAYD